MARELGRLPRHEARETERPRPRRRQGGHAAPVAPAGLEGLRRCQHDVGDQVRPVRHRPRGGQFHGEVVDLAVGFHHRDAPARDGAARRVELRAVVAEEAIEVPDHRIGIEGRAVMEGHAATQVEAPFLRVVRVLLPALSEARAQPRHLVAARQVPQHQRFEHRIAEEAHPLEAVVRHAGGGRHVGRGHGDAQGARLLLRQRGAGAEQQRGRDRARREARCLGHEALPSAAGAAMGQA